MDDLAVAHTTIGVCLVGGLVSFMLFGVMTTQTYIYYKRFSDDSLKLKALVALMWYDPAHNIDSTERVTVNRTCDSAHTLCVGHLLYVYTIYDNAHTETILGRPAPKSYSTAIFLYGVTGAIVIWFAAFIIEAKIFSNSLLASLNSQETLRAINDQNISLSLSRTTPSSIVHNGEPAKIPSMNGNVVEA
ncbi:hypothetical protein B0H14DRAFT_3693893 [Mycena olivaceomarginata]|nr:hypothetical protein B0H14DRAFT_3693893 [Mycena olivaceomarginata]